MGSPELNDSEMEVPIYYPAKEAIDRAIRENRYAELLLYAFAAVFVIIGGSAVILGAYRTTDSLATQSVVGGLFGAMCVPSFWMAFRIRTQNLAIRLLEIPLSLAETAEEAARILSNHFVQVHKGGLPNRENDRAQE